ncbi:RDD family protein [Pontibacter actiniarum]|uniref:RDD family protein n=1 Tax=Pontibacter actiniarum TaxID=323450 RepID=A0A1X9YTN8_9BACT|nr:RDD family protein [Pontibacter actiniarum]ARS36212.1 RDD family protein [Pontibacter actiniarum]
MQTTYTQSKNKAALADLGTRLMAFSLDVLLLLTLVAVTDFYTFSSNEQALLLKPERLLHLLLAWLYFAGTETCACQGTLGKHLMNLRVTDAAGDRLTIKAATIRFFARPVSALMLLFRFLTDSAYDSRRTFHDRLADSQVVER